MKAAGRGTRGPGTGFIKRHRLWRAARATSSTLIGCFATALSGSWLSFPRLAVCSLAMESALPLASRPRQPFSMPSQTSTLIRRRLHLSWSFSSVRLRRASTDFRDPCRCIRSESGYHLRCSVRRGCGRRHGSNTRRRHALVVYHTIHLWCIGRHHLGRGAALPVRSGAGTVARQADGHLSARNHAGHPRRLYDRLCACSAADHRRRVRAVRALPSALAPRACTPDPPRACACLRHAACSPNRHDGR